MKRRSFVKYFLSLKVVSLLIPAPIRLLLEQKQAAYDRQDDFLEAGGFFRLAYSLLHTERTEHLGRYARLLSVWGHDKDTVKRLNIRIQLLERENYITEELQKKLANLRGYASSLDQSELQFAQGQLNRPEMQDLLEKREKLILALAEAGFPDTPEYIENPLDVSQA